jgi:acyl-CoA thioesterase I
MRPRELIPFWFLLAVALVACSGSSRALPPLAPDAVIVAFGDSLTYGTGARPDESYPAVLSRLTGRKVVNAGVPGEVSASGLKRLPRVLERQAPNLVVLAHGGNDILRRRDLDQTEANLRQMIRLIRESGASVVLLGVPKAGLWLSSAKFYGTVAEELDIPFEGKIIPDLLGDNRMKSDAIHPNAQGYRKMAEAVHALLKEAGAI